MPQNRYDIAVLIRTLGNPNLLSTALTSLRKQDFKNFQVVIVEDGPSTLAAFLSQYTDLAIHYESMGSRSGRSKTGNKALEVARAEYFIFLDDDDFLYPHHLSDLLKHVHTENCRIAYSWSEQRSILRDHEGNIIKTGIFKRIRRETFSPLHLLSSNYIPINAVLFHRSLYETAGGFDENLDYLEDWLLWLNYLALEPIWVCTRNITAVYHVFLNHREYYKRRKIIRSKIAYVEQTLSGIKPSWDLNQLRRDCVSHFALSIIARKIFYRFIGYKFSHTLFK